MALPPAIVAGVARRLAEHAGLELPAWVVEARAAARMAELGLAPDAYVELLGHAARGEPELGALVESVRVGESRLFRHRAQIAALADVIAPALRRRRAVKVWSAGCAAGEEPYTLAAVLARALPGLAISITATDVSADAIAAAQRATYPASAWQDIPEPWRDAFERTGDEVRVRPELTALVRFERANLADPRALAPRGCDIVWCRNVLIYFTPEARRRVIERLVAATAPGGYVFVGYSESLRDVADLEATRAGEAVYYVRRGDDRASRSSGSLPQAPRAATPPAGVPIVPAGVSIVPVATPRSVPVPYHVEDPTPPPTRLTDEPDEDVLVLRGTPTARVVTAELGARLAIAGLQRLVIDLDAADLLEDELAPVLRRARAAARTAQVELVVRATRPGARRWLARHDLDGGEP